ncbi:conjugal transfer protein TraD [Legionella pneumophila serogroup 1]|uniref:conjugal transfer protein TraD n=1 Tax=Legionella pneumophila TaxID=446 RepID=UPI001A236F98|nr:conjugal transfer protein TraD [Legionella pneumophila]MCH9108507.1 conjugal transfer protein TraD [Legionella pneumophila serogroup 1]MCH9115255.1 conjugal transfer protein TraD [Legionella pneumophila serogroup 1]MDW8895612.1 conjugal transfer protein TraD [Legionella pneumophila]MDW9033734.1 conjugal transfer protein TraD [Legionella pneumophila]MDW9048720.1 conjugal transfer protein TraD [Legionella pneumophila]
MDTNKQIKKQKQIIARDEKALILAKLKKRKADTRRKIELGGLVIKAEADFYSKSTILGALDYAVELIKKDKCNQVLFEQRGKLIFIKQERL